MSIYDPRANTWSSSFNKAPEGVEWGLNHLGFAVMSRFVPSTIIDAAKRLLNLEIVEWGLPVDQIREWHQNKTWFPTLRFAEEIMALSRFVPKELYGTGELCEPQILCHYPDHATEWDFEFHLDQEPSWAEGRKYSLIAGVALTPNTSQNGGLVVRPPFGYGLVSGDPVELDAGDIIVFKPQLWHRSGLNKTGDVRMMVYFRWLEAK